MDFISEILHSALDVIIQFGAVLVEVIVETVRRIWG